ncbi:putative RNA methylase [Mesorhizobium robiniae]|uniref:RNA methylase n=1 Tax=Mesorhizobium robiniae TaxID=559315 RepID=A0ABV2GNL0_9HYPH
MRWPNRTPHVLTQVWLVRRDTVGRNGMLRGRCAGSGRLRVARLARGTYRVIAWDTAADRQTAEWQANSDGWLKLDVPPFSADVALAIRRV